MYRGQFKVGFLINEDCFCHLCKVSSDFIRICKLSEIQAEKKVVKCYNHRSTLGIPSQCIITCSNFVLSTTGSDSVMCSKFQINLMQYGDFQNEQRYQRDSPWKLYIEVKSWTVCKTTKMYPGQFKVAFFINKDCFGHLCKVSSDFARICKLSEIEEEKRKW